MNAIYLKANWQHEFDPDRTETARSPPATARPIRVPTMHLFGGQNVALATGDGWQATELPYAGADGARRSR